MKKIVLTSKNPVKISAVKNIVEQLFLDTYFEYIPLDLDAKNAELFGKQQILAFMKNSLSSAREAISDAEYYVCMQGGMEDSGDEMHETAYVMVSDSSGRSEVSGCSTFRVPTQVANEVRNGKDFAKSVDEFFKVQNTKTTGGFVSILTNGIVNKESHYSQPFAIAISTLIQKSWFM
jgi:non-canonical (house-cleaning) NTP pyrophosphatase